MLSGILMRAEFLRAHRTLEQSFVVTLVMLLKHAGESECSATHITGYIRSFHLLSAPESLLLSAGMHLRFRLRVFDSQSFGPFKIRAGGMFFLQVYMQVPFGGEGLVAVLALQNLLPSVVCQHSVVVQRRVSQESFTAELTDVSLDARVNVQVRVQTGLHRVSLAADVTGVLLDPVSGQLVLGDHRPLGERFPADVALLGLEDLVEARHVRGQTALGVAHSSADLTAELGGQLLWVQAARDLVLPQGLFAETLSTLCT